MGIQYYVHVGMNRPTVKTPRAVQNILQQYDVRPLLQVVTGKKVGANALAFIEDEHMKVHWPSAVRADELPYVAEDEDLEQLDVRWEVEEKLHEERGQQGLTDLLLALAPYLNSPLVLQSATCWSDGQFCKAKEWIVQPGAAEVEVKEILAMDDEHCIVSCD